jgi:hypothetical protein
LSTTASFLSIKQPKHALSLAKLGRMKEAVPVYDRAVEALRGSSKKARASLLAQRAMGLHSLGRSQEAAASVRLDGDLLLARCTVHNER